MKDKFLLIAFLIILLSPSGCKSIHIGGSGQIGDIQGGGGVTIPVPSK